MSYDGESIVYDASGNPTTYRGATLGFEAGRRLKKLQKAGDANAYEFTFDCRGVRKSKKTKDADGHDKTWSFYYDEDGKLWGETKSEKVLQGNFGIQLWTDKITRIGFFPPKQRLGGLHLVKTDGDCGRCKGGLYLPQKRFGRHRRNLRHRHEFNRGVRLRRMGQLHDRGFGSGQHRDNGNQPSRYRGYYWDKELNLYYLQTRYYDPQTGRFINADNVGYGLTQFELLNGLNLYSYCLNNPIGYTDESGSSLILIGLILGAIIGGTAGRSDLNKKKPKKAEQKVGSL